MTAPREGEKMSINTLQNISCKLRQTSSRDNSVRPEFEKWRLQEGEKMKLVN